MREIKLIVKLFLIVGLSSFGGYSALIAVVQRLFVEQRKLLKESVIVEGFSLASLLPGPVAVNTVTYIGYNLASWPGALLSMLAVILPSMVFMLVLAVIYQHAGMIPEVSSFLLGVIPVIMALIFTVIWKMGQTAFRHWTQYTVFLITLILQFSFTGYWVFIVAILFGALVGFVAFRNKGHKSWEFPKFKIKWYQPAILLVLFLTLLSNFLDLSGQPVLFQLFSVFAGVSLTLFGGGYVMIPMLEELVVMKYAWLTSAEFIDAIVLGQATPGPILISATFIGYQVAGFLGAVVATLAIFTPSALLITLLVDIFDKKDRTSWQPVINGIKPVVIGLMTYSIWILLKSFTVYYYPVLAGLIAAFILIRFQVHFLWLILVFGLAGVLIFNA